MIKKYARLLTIEVKQPHKIIEFIDMRYFKGIGRGRNYFGTVGSGIRSRERKRDSAGRMLKTLVE